MKAIRDLYIALLIILLGMGAFWAQAEPVPLGTAQVAARMFFRLEKARSPLQGALVGISGDAVISGMQALRNGTTGASLAYVFDILPVGYLIVSTDTMITPIVAYSYNTDFSWEDVAENILLQMLKVDMRNRLQAISQGLMDMQVVAENEELWGEYLGEDSTKLLRRNPTVYGPWLTTNWHQHSPYNDNCPLDPITGNRCVVGCVATALSQIINYWQYPPAVTFIQSDSYTSEIDPNDGKGTRTISIDATTASFSGLSYDNCNPSDSAKADLCFAAGVSVRMGYSSAGSGASTGKVAPALAGSYYPYSGKPPERWGYISADLLTCNNDYDWWDPPHYVSEDAFYDQLSENMQLAQPAEMTITGSLGGHAIVVDGWQSGGRTYHLNFGWYGGSSTAWYALPSGLPADLNAIRYVVLSIIPTSITQFLTVSTSGSGSGSVTKTPNQSSFTRGTHVILTAVPDSGSTFDHWEGDLTGSTNPARIIMDGDRTVTAVFASSSYSIDYVVAHWLSGALDPNDPCQISLDQILQAIAWWAAATPVPQTGGQTIDLDKILDLIAKWAAATCIDSAPSPQSLLLPKALPTAEAATVVEARRGITLSPGGKAEVTVTVDANQAITGLALDEDLPQGWRITPIDNAGATFNAQETQWLWLEVSAGETKTIRYQVKIPSDTPVDALYEITGVIRAASPSLVLEVVGDVQLGERLPAGQLQVVAIPNPVRDVHTVTFQVQGALASLVEAVKVEIYDLGGKLVYEKQEAGTSLDWHTDDSYGEYLANGVYLYKLYALVEGKWVVSEVKKLAILR